jgi:hypothetical protein
VETTRWARWAQQVHADLGLPPNPRLGVLLGAGLAYAGRVIEAIAACEEAAAIATSIGSEADFDRFEALYQLVFMRAMQGTPDISGAEEVAALATSLGSTWLLVRAKTGLGVALTTVDPHRATVAFDDALDLARHADPPYWTGSARVIAAGAHSDPYVAISQLASSLDDFRAAGSQQWVRRSLRDFLVHFGAVGRHEVVAFIDGCAAPVSLRPNQGRDAVVAARQHLGASSYEAAKARGAAVSDTDLPELLRSEIADLFSTEGRLVDGTVDSASAS